MKKHLLIAFLIAAAGLVNAEAQSQTFTAPAGQRTERVQPRTTPPPVRRGELGAFPRAARGGNPLHLFNPVAPRKYFGAPQDTVTWQPHFEREPYTGHRITGVILFGIAW